VTLGALASLVVGNLGGCVPTGSAPPFDAGPSPAQSTSFRPSINVMTTPFEDTFDRPDGSDGLAVPPAGLSDAALSLGPIPSGSSTSRSDARAILAPLEAGGRDAIATIDGQEPTGMLADGGVSSLSLDGGAAAAGGPDAGRPSNLGPNWSAMRTNAWRIENGRLCAENARNHGVWLNKTLPVNARIEFDAWALNDVGDLKAEVWGDGHSYATSSSYTMATSYLAILGGWKNSLHVLARLNEHGDDRQVIHVDKDSDDPRQRAIVRGQLYSFKIERTDGKTVRVSVNGIEYFAWADPAPLTGFGHDHFGFNEWEAKVCFDNVKVTPL
jgi:hypothetical protein